jgi:hypothetical protein
MNTNQNTMGAAAVTARAITYKVWVEIEEYDVEAGECRNLDSDNFNLPFPTVFLSREKAIEHAQTLAQIGQVLTARVAQAEGGAS